MAQWQSEYMQQRENIIAFLDTLKEKYVAAEAAKEAGTPPSLTLDQATADACLIARIEGAVKNPYMLNEIREYANMVARCRTWLGGSASATAAKNGRSSTKKPGQLFRKKTVFDDIGAVLDSGQHVSAGLEGNEWEGIDGDAGSYQPDASGTDAVPDNVVPFSAYRHSPAGGGGARRRAPSGNAEHEPAHAGADAAVAAVAADAADASVDAPADTILPGHAANNASAGDATTNPASAASSPSVQRVRRLSSREAQDAMRDMHKMDDDFTRALEDILAHRYEETLAFGAAFGCTDLAAYLKRIAGDELYLDPLFSMTQQYALADTPIVNEQNHQIGSTGFHLALIGDPGTGKTFAIKELIVGNEKEQKPAHGLIGRNKVLGTVSAAAFVRFAEAYEGTKINFIVPELGSWLGYTGVFDLLKRIMEEGLAEHHVKNEHIGPYRFDSFFSVNYNPELKNGAMALPTNDPNFKAVIDRMVNHAQWQTESRYDAVAESQMRGWEGTTSMDLSQRIQDHLMLVYAAQTRHPSVVGILPQKPVVATGAFFDALRDVRESICEQIRTYSAGEADGTVRVPFSPRLEKSTMNIASALSLIEYFQPPKYAQEEGIAGSMNPAGVVAAATPSIEISKPATNYALYSMIQQAALRSNGAIDAAYTCAQFELIP